MYLDPSRRRVDDGLVHLHMARRGESPSTPARAAGPPPAPDARQSGRGARASRPALPTRRSGAAYSTTIPTPAGARARTTSLVPIPSTHSSARARTTSALAIPAAARSPSMNAHLRVCDSTSRNSTPGSATASASPGKPAPEPRSAIFWAAESASSSSATSESARCTSIALTGSRTVVGARSLLASPLRIASSWSHWVLAQTVALLQALQKPREGGAVTSFHVKQPMGPLPPPARPPDSARASPSLWVRTSSRSRRCSWTIRRSDAGIGASSTASPTRNASSTASSASSCNVRMRRSRYPSASITTRVPDSPPWKTIRCARCWIASIVCPRRPIRRPTSPPST